MNIKGAALREVSMFDESAARKVDALTLGSCPMADAGLGLFRCHRMTHDITV